VRSKDAAGPTITVRTLALGLVLLVAFIVVAPTLRAYLDQRQQYRALESELRAVGADVEALDAELRRWSDPAYVQAQARERLSFVQPGEAAFRVIDPETVVGEDDAVGALEGLEESVDTAPVVPWYLAVWESVQDAGEPPAE
jgi:cell division protein FtsB